MKYTIKKGKHTCKKWWLKIFKIHWNKDRWYISFKLTESCWWSPIRNTDDYDINKLHGIGFGFNHHENSWRLGWAPYFENVNIFKLFAYIYDSNGHVSQEIGSFEANKDYICSIESKNNAYYFTCLGVGSAILANNIKDSKLQFELFFYHGGNNTAPKDEIAFIELKTKI
jgi:hypothetical protein